MRRDDPLSAPAVWGPSRVAFHQPQLLDTEDWVTEQTYHRGRLARALRYVFGTGTVAGLEVTWSAVDGELKVAPGLAIDPLGRLIEIPREQCLQLRAWFEQQWALDRAEAWLLESSQPVLYADVFVRLAVCEQGATPTVAQGPFDATDAFAPARLREAFELGLILRTETGAIRRASGDASQLPRPDLDELLMAQTNDLAALHARILSRWRDTPADWQRGQPPRLPEHLLPRAGATVDDPTALGRDTTSVLLARIAVEVAPPQTSDADPVLPDPFVVRAPDNLLRRFIYSLGHLVNPV